MNLTPLQKIRAACIAANPEITELKFGCEIYDHMDGQKHFVTSVNNLGTHDMTVLFQGEIVRMVSGVYEKNNYEILGRPIRLADVLLAIDGTYRHGDAITVRIIPGGTFERLHTGNVLPGEWNPQVRWNLRADDLEKQSEETIDFLYELLK